MSDDITEKAAMMRNCREIQERDHRAWQEIRDRNSRLKEMLAAKDNRIQQLRETLENLRRYGLDRDAEIATNDSLNNDLMANCNQLRDRCWKAESELARWQKIAKEERARFLMTSNNDRAIYEYIGQIKGNENFMEQAAEELNLQVARESGYIDRLEAAYIDAKSQLEAGCGWDGEQIEVEERDLIEAQSALAKIREGG